MHTTQSELSEEARTRRGHVFLKRGGMIGCVLGTIFWSAGIGTGVGIGIGAAIGFYWGYRKQSTQGKGN